MKKQLFVPVLFLISNLINAQVTPPCYSPAVNYSMGTATTAICVVSSDFNNDGNKDIVVANFQSSNISVMLGFGNGNFSPAVNYTVGVNPYSVTNGDFNSDGITDLATANWGSADVHLSVGETIQLGVWHDNTAGIGLLSTVPSRNYFNCHKVN